MNSVQEIIIHRPKIELHRDQNGKTYFLIHDQATGIAYFAFFGLVKKGWYDLTAKWTKAKEVHLQFGNDPKKVLNLTLLTNKDIRERKRRERERERDITLTEIRDKLLLNSTLNSPFSCHQYTTPITGKNSPLR